MQKHVKNYMEAMGFTEGDFMPCEACSLPGNEVHHVEPRSSFGSKRKAEQDHHSNLIMLCRPCHNDAHGPQSREIKEVLKSITASFRLSCSFLK